MRLATNHERGAIGLMDGVIAVGVVALASVGLLTINLRTSVQRTGPAITPAITAGINAATDLKAVSEYGTTPTGVGATPAPAAVPAALAGRTISITDASAVLPSPTPFPHALANGFTVPPMQEKSSAVSLTSAAYNPITQTAPASLTVTGANSSYTVPLAVTQSTVNEACTAAYKALNGQGSC
jgi:hypothetical protein